MAIESIQLQHFLSYGDAAPFALSGLNVLIGPNGSGKSNLIEAFSLLQSLPGDVRRTIHRGGGVDEWVSKLSRGRPTSITVTHLGAILFTLELLCQIVGQAIVVCGLPDHGPTAGDKIRSPAPQPK